MLMRVVTSALMLSLIYAIPAYAQLASQGGSTNVPDLPSVHPKPDSSPIVAIIVINRNEDGSITYVPDKVTVKADDEILVLNNDSTSAQSMTNGVSPNDPVAGKIFDTGPIPPKGFVEIAFPYFKPDTYPFHSTSSISTKGVLIVEPKT